MSFKNTVIIMTSNLGSEWIAEESLARRGGDQGEDRGVPAPPLPARVLQPDRRRHRLPPPDARGDREDRRDPAPERGEDRARPRHRALTWTPAAGRFLAGRGYDPTFGARPLKRLIQKQVSDVLAPTDPGRARSADGRHRRARQLSTDGESLVVDKEIRIRTVWFNHNQGGRHESDAFRPLSRVRVPAGPAQPRLRRTRPRAARTRASPPGRRPSTSPRRRTGFSSRRSCPGFKEDQIAIQTENGMLTLSRRAEVREGDDRQGLSPRRALLRTVRPQLQPAEQRRPGEDQGPTSPTGCSRSSCPSARTPSPGRSRSPAGEAPGDGRRQKAK